jgi:hypothetical protein
MTTTRRRRIHPYTYTVCRKERNRPLRGHHRRDATAALEILPALFELGFCRGQQLFAQPPLVPDPVNPAQRLRVDRSGLEPGDLILQTTRPPMEKGRGKVSMKQVEPAYTDLEDDLFAVWRLTFPECTRPCAAIRGDLTRHLVPGFENRATMYFSQRTTGAPYTHLHASISGARREKQARLDRTAAFFLRVDEVWRGGPGLIGAFAMDGTANMVWAWHLARDFAYLLAEPGFAVVEMEIGDVPVRPTDLRWARSWKLTEILRVGPDQIRAAAPSGLDADVA